MANIPSSSNQMDDNSNDDQEATNQSQTCYLCSQSSEQLLTETLSSESSQQEDCANKCVKCGLDLSQQELFNVTVKYSAQVQKVKKQDKIVENLQQKAINDERNFQECLMKYKEKHSDMGKILEKLSELGVYNSAINIKIIKSQFVQKCGELCDTQQQFIESASIFQETKENLQIQIRHLEKKEEDLVSTREQLQNVTTKFGLATQYTDPINVLSKEYYRNISEKNFTDMFAYGGVENVSVCLESPQQCKDIDVFEDICVKGLRIRAPSDQVKYLSLNFKKGGLKVVFEKCEFEGIGLLLNVDKKESIPNNKLEFDYPSNSNILENVSITNVNVSNVPYGLAIYSSKNCYIQKVDVKIKPMNEVIGSAIILVEVEKFRIDSTKVEDGCHGFYFVNSSGDLANCLARNSLEYGLHSDGQKNITGENVKFENNQKGEVKGNYKTK